MRVMDNHPQTSLAQLREDSAIEVQFKTVGRRWVPLNVLLGSSVRCMVDVRLLVRLESIKDVLCLLKNLVVRKHASIKSELIPPVPYRPHHKNHELRVHPSLMRHLKQLHDV